MSWQQPELSSSNHTNTSTDYSSYIDYVKKPVEIYVFIDPFSEVCWSLQTYLKKLTLEYGRFFTIRPIISGYLSLLNDKKKKILTRNTALYPCHIAACQQDYGNTHPWITSLALKAAELQGKRAGKKFLGRVQHKLFLEKQNISELDVLLECALEANLDMQEFEKDILSSPAKKAYQCDLRLTNEMDVDNLPTMVFFNQMVEEHGIKVSGLYPYEIYELVLSEILRYQPIPSAKPPLEDLITHHAMLGTKEVSIIYDWSITKTEKEMKKLQVMQKVEKINSDYGVFWKVKN
ncbi:DsbA family protein [Ralstonia pickettii]|nr:DsbA family protein [Ralstonia pickettii]